MGKASISIGVDDATGQPESAPVGPYITDRDDGSPRPKKKSATRGRARETSGPAQPHRSRRASEDLASRRKGPTQR
jgi:hypothetical protein